MTQNNSIILEALRWRYSVKKFDPTKKIKDEDLKTLQQALILTASSLGLQPWKFIFVKNQNLRAQLVEHSFGQKQVAEASDLLVIAAKKNMDEAYVEAYLKRSSIERKTDAMAISLGKGVTSYNVEDYKRVTMGFIKNFGDNILAWNQKQCYIALGNLLTVAAFLKIDTLPMEGFVPEKYNEILEIPQDYTATLVVPLGYRSEEDKNSKYNKVRFSEEELIIVK